MEQVRAHQNLQVYYTQCEDRDYSYSEQTGMAYGYTLDATNFTLKKKKQVNFSRLKQMSIHLN